MQKVKPLVLNDFCMRQFTPNKKNGQINLPIDPKVFTEEVNKLYCANPDLKPGYADFCKHLIIPNMTEAKVYYAKINSENESKLRTEYVARTENELPVLKRFFKQDDMKPEKAKYLDIILYSKAQIDYEEGTMKEKGYKLNPTDSSLDYDWGIISVKPQNEDFEIPMDPITMMRNALGAEEGGSGVKLEREKYMKSVNFWKEHAIIT